MEDVIFLKPVFKQNIWGGERLKTVFGYDIPTNQTGECWGVSAHPNGDCEILNGSFKGHTLSYLWTKHRELFGNYQSSVFPLLVKIIDAKADLSIQVHPDNEYAKTHEKGALGKTECWYILDCNPDATIIIGHNANSKEELKDDITQCAWKKLLREIPIRKGDFFQIEPGTIHAIKAGTLILETQQDSDITYRLYDYDRLQNGKPRPLHIRQSIDVIKCPYIPANTTRKRIDYEHVIVNQLISCPYYTVELQNVTGRQLLKKTGSFELASIIDGTGSIDTYPVKKGDHLILTDVRKEYELDGKMTLIHSFV